MPGLRQTLLPGVPGAVQVRRGVKRRGGLRQRRPAPPDPPGRYNLALEEQAFFPRGRYNPGMPRRVREFATLAANVPTGIVQIRGQRRRFYLRKPIDLKIHPEAGRWVIEYEPLNLAVYEANEDAAYSAFAEEFEAVWEHIVDSPDRSLTRDARELKAAFRDLVEDVEATAA